MRRRITTNLDLAPKPRITREEAERIARQECEGRGVPWIHPMVMSDGVRSWNIALSASSFGCNIFTSVDTVTGRIVGIDGLLPSE